MEWHDVFTQESPKPYFQDLQNIVARERSEHSILPEKEDVFNAFELSPFAETKVVILGQDPYPTKGQAHGLSFSVRNGFATARSLCNIFKELGLKPPYNGDLTDWAKQGVLLLNCVLTVCEGKRNSHKGIGWEKFIDANLVALNHREAPAVFLLWGKDAQKKAELITNPAHLVLMAAHPSPMSANRGFFGCNHFNLANEFLVKNGQPPIDWTSSHSLQ